MSVRMLQLDVARFRARAGGCADARRLAGSPRPGALSQPADPHDRAVHRRHRHRHTRARHRAEAVRAPQGAGGGREPRRRQRQYRHRSRVEVACGRLHAAHDREHHRAERSAVALGALRPGARLHADRPRGDRQHGAGGASLGSGEIGGGIRRLGQGAAGPAQLRLARQRHAPPPGDGIVQAELRHRHHARAVQRARPAP